MKKKILKISAAILSLTLMISIITFISALAGNPVSEYLATKSATEYLEINHGNEDFVIEEVYHDFKTGGYHAEIISPTSMDRYFSLSFNLLGKLTHDTYDDITTGRNTVMRIDREYRNVVENAIKNKEFSRRYSIAYGEIAFVLSDQPINKETPMYAMRPEELIIDKEYDINEIGAKHGEIIIYAYDDDVSVERLAKLLLEAKQEFDKAGVTFKTIEFVLEKEKIEGQTLADDEQIRVRNFYYEDIYEKDLTERVRISNEKAIKYYEQQEKIKEVEALLNNK
jgi:hypothetical protein